MAGRWYIDSIDVAGGFLAGVSLRLPKGLICVIGPRGSGKSTFAEAIRYSVGNSAGASKGRLELIRANLAPAAITLGTLDADGAPGYLVKRPPGQPPVLTSADGRPIPAVDLERGTFLPLDAYSSTEIEDIANETLGERRRALLDELRSEDLHKIRQEVTQCRRRLEANADSVRASRKLVADHTERIEELGDVRARLAALGPLPENDASTRLAEVAKRRQELSRQSKIATDLSDTWERGRAAADAFLTDHIATAERIARDISSSSMPLLATLVTTHRDGVAALKRLALDLAQAFAAPAGAATTSSVAVRNSLAEIGAAAAKLEAENQSAGDAIRNRASIEQAVARLDQFEMERTAARKQLAEFLEERKKLKAAYLLARDRVSDIREEVATALQRDAGAKVRIRVVRNADSLAYRQLLLDALQGARVRNHDDILQSLTRMRPEQLAQVIQDGDPDELEAQTAIGRDRCDRILDAFRLKIDPLALEVVDIDDRVCIELNVAGAGTPNYKDASELSRGQKCTALLPQLLARRSIPLVIDQPEDNLDNHFIYETVVETVRRMKTKRQMIFITHNANIPVLGEADLVIVLNSDGKTGYVERAGTLDDCRDAIIDLLEGGREAFDLRRRRYGRE
jgi:energy-coupling factor transporter ATP-binding protein EcfA2